MKSSLALVALCAQGAGASMELKPTKGGHSTEFSHVRTETFTHKLGYTVHTSTYLSNALELGPGEMIFTQTKKTPLMMPPAGSLGYAITGFSGEIVDGKNMSAPLSTCYDHHWIAVQETHTNPFCGGAPNYIVGIGAESRNTPDRFPSGYGYVVKPHENKWGTNIHLLHTEGLSGDPLTAVKECNECFYAPDKAPTCTPQQNGTFECCGESCGDHECFCPTAAGVDRNNRSTFHLSYQVNYTYDLEQITPLEIGILAAPDCKLFYDVYENDEQPEHVTRTSWEAPKTVEAVYAVGHQHVGALNISLLVNDEIVCTSYPRYGETPEKVGDEYGYLVEMSTCLDKDTSKGSYHVTKGDKITVESWYWVGSNDTRIYPHPGGTHLNVMAYMYIAFV